jgi:hypothetical protein
MQVGIRNKRYRAKSSVLFLRANGRFIISQLGIGTKICSAFYNSGSSKTIVAPVL